jgi:hypothetical protein
MKPIFLLVLFLLPMIVITGYLDFVFFGDTDLDTYIFICFWEFMIYCVGLITGRLISERLEK